MRTILARYLSAFTLVSRIPLKLRFAPDHSRGDLFLPLVGPAASAFALAGLFGGGFLLRDAQLAALASVLVQYLAFNLFHLDGLLDSADALLPFVPRERRDEILKDPRIGSFALFAGFLLLAARTAALARLVPGGRAGAAALAALLAAPAAGRAAAALVPSLAPPARPGGLGALAKGYRPGRAALGLALALFPLGAWALLAGPGFRAAPLVALAAAPVAACAAAILMARAYKAKLGGFTGDCLGAAVEIGELLVILACAALLSPAGFLR